MAYLLYYQGLHMCCSWAGLLEPDEKMLPSDNSISCTLSYCDIFCVYSCWCGMVALFTLLYTRECTILSLGIWKEVFLWAPSWYVGHE